MEIEIWSDVVCPWCAIGKRRLEQVLDDWTHADEVTVRFRSFELDPRAPRERGGGYAEGLAAKYGTSVEQARAMIDRMTGTGAEAGIEFRFDRARPGNTFDAHRLLHLAEDRGVQYELKDRLLRAYHTEGEPIGQPDTLRRLAAETGLDDSEVGEVLTGDRYADAVRADERRAMELGISGVPAFLLDGMLLVPGAQPADVLLHALERVRERRTALASG